MNHPGHAPEYRLGMKTRMSNLARVDAVMAQHPIQVAARRSGLSTHVIRAWEKRYEAVQPDRSDTARRMYSDGEIARLTLLRRVTEAGWRIGDVAQMDDERLAQLLRDEGLSISRSAGRATSVDVSATLPQMLDLAVDTVARLDGTGLLQVASRAFTQHSLVAVMERFVQPLLDAVAERRHVGRMRACHEHFVGTQLRTALGRLLQDINDSSEGPVLLVTSHCGQHQEVGALAAAVVAARAGWSVMYPGAGLASEEIVFAADVSQARGVVLNLSGGSGAQDISAQLLRLREKLSDSVPIFVNGKAVPGHARALRQIGALMPQDLYALERDLEALRRARG